MRPLSEETLNNMIKELPSFSVLNEGINNLLEQGHGVVPSFQEILEEIKEIRKIDLFNIDPF